MTQDKLQAIKNQYEGEQLGEFLLAYTDGSNIEVYVFRKGSVVIQGKSRTIGGVKQWMAFFQRNMTQEGIELIEINSNPDSTEYPSSFKSRVVKTFC